jgi:hypothetical protein
MGIWKRNVASKNCRQGINNSQTQPLVFEQLEDRIMLAGEVEPNNTLSLANGFSGSDTLAGMIANINDVDHFKTTLNSGDTLWLRYTENQTDGSPAILPTMEILNSAGAVKSSSLDANSLRFTVARSGIYYLRITANNVYGNVVAAYDITADREVFSGTTEIENNNSVARANPLLSNTSFRGALSNASDIDYFSLYGVAGQAISVNFPEKPSLNPSIRLYSPLGSFLASNLSGLGLSVVLPETGIYQFAIRSDNVLGSVTGEYAGQLLVSANPTADSELGNDLDASVKLDLGPHVVPAIYLSPNQSFNTSGLTGSYINQSLRNVNEADWRLTRPIAGNRVDQVIHFSLDGWGQRSDVGLTNGTDDNWDDFSVQWDGYIRVVEDGTRIYDASDDGSRMWIDLNQDGVFTSGTELVDNHWGQGQGNTLSLPSAPLAPGDYRIRIQYEEGGGGNNAYLLWSDANRSAGIVSRNNQREGVGTLVSLNDIDTYVVNVSGTGFYEFALASTSGGLSSQNRVITLYNEFGQEIERSAVGSMTTNRHAHRVEQTSKYFITVQATQETGLGAYQLQARITGEFPQYRNIPLFFQDYSGYSKTNHIDEFLAFFESRYDGYQIDLTQLQPSAIQEFVSWTFNDAGPGCGGAAGGWYGLHSSSGAGSGSCDANWTSLADVWFGLFYHENGHGVGLPHARHPLEVMSYGGQYDYFQIGSYNFMGGIYGNGDARISLPKVQNARNYLDWTLEAGRILLEGESNGNLVKAQWLDPSLAEMTTDADPRNDQVVVVGSIDSPTDVDVFRFSANAGETFAIDVEAAEFQYPLDSFLELVNANGTILATSQGAIDRDSGIDSVDPYLVYRFTNNGKYFVRLRGESGTTGNYRLKLTPERAFDNDGPRVAAVWPNGDAVIDSTRQLIFWFNDQIDPATLSPSNIIVRGAKNGVQAGTAVFDPFTTSLIWRASSPLPVDNYTVQLMSGANGIKDLQGNSLDGDTDGSLNWPEVSGNGTAGGTFNSRFTINQTDTFPAQLNFSDYVRHDHDRGMFTLYFNDELDVRDVYSSTFTLRGAGADHLMDTSDDTFSPVDVFYDQRSNGNNHTLRIYTRGVPQPDQYRVEANLHDAAGNPLAVSEYFNVPAPVPSEFLFTTSSLQTAGLRGSYVNTSLRSYMAQDDWRVTQSIAGTRTDPIIDFNSDSLGVRSAVNITGGTDQNWDNFSVQWDGFIVIPTDGTRLFTRSDDGSRIWIDVNGDGNFNTSGAEFLNNNWGYGQGATTSAPSVVLTAGTYRIRIQYEEGDGGNRIQLMWNASAGSSASSQLSTLKVVDVNVQPHTSLASPPATIGVTFSEDVKLNTLDTNTFRLRYSEDSTFFDGNDTFVAATNDQIVWNPMLFSATLTPIAPLLDGYYLIELDGTASGIAATNGRLLDGEYRDTNIAGFESLHGWNMSPSGDGLPGGSYRAMFVVATPTLQMQLTSDTISENGGLAATTGIVTRLNTDLSAPLIVTLSSNDTSEATVPLTVTIPANRISATFAINAIDDNDLDGTQLVTLTAAAGGFASDHRTLYVTDHENSVSIVGTNGSDVFEFIAGGRFTIRINGQSYILDSTFLDIEFQGNGGKDTITVIGGASNETATLRAGSLNVSGGDYTLNASNVENVTVNAGNGNDRANFYDSAGNDSFIGFPTYSSLTGSGFYNQADGFETVYAYASAGDAGGIGDRAYLYDSAGNDSFYGRSTYSRMFGTGFNNYASGFDTVRGYATAGNAGGVGDRAYLYDSAGNERFYGRSTYSRMLGADFDNYASGFGIVNAIATAGDVGGLGDRAYLYDSAGNDRFYAYPTYSYLTGNNFYNQAKGFDAVYGNATAGGTNDRAYLYDSAGNDRFYAYPTYSYLTGSNFYNQANGFDTVYGYATAGDVGGVGDRAYLYDSAGNDSFYGRSTYSRIFGDDFDNFASGFDTVYGYATAGNVGGVGDRAYLYDSAGNDRFYGRPTYSRMLGTDFENYASGFGIVNAIATAGDVGGLGDRAYLYDSAGNDRFYAYPTYSYLTGNNFYNQARGFDAVYGNATAGGTNDRAYLYDSAGNDKFYAYPTYSYLTGSSFYNQANGFKTVYGYATAGDVGGVGDRAYLYDSAGNDRFYGRPAYSRMLGTNFDNYASGFDKVYAYATAGDVGGVGDRAYLYDSAGDDSFYGRNDYGRLSGTGFLNFVQSFDRVYAYANESGFDTIDNKSLNYQFFNYGTWEKIL